jgi:methylthioribose-1-phosphate isomerase
LYVLCETLKFDARLKSSEVKLEEKETSEVAGPGILPERTVILNPYFDITPLEMIRGIITEDGLVRQNQVPDYIQKLALHNRL